MKKIIHSISVRVFTKDESEVEQIIQSFFELFKVEKEEEIKSKVDKLENDEKEPFFIIKAVIEKQRSIKQTVEHWKETIPKDEWQKIASEKESRLDDNLNFFIRFKLSTWLEKNKLKVTDSGDCVHVTLLIASFPKSRENALIVLDELFS